MYPDEYINFLAHFHGSRDYFECHEILEELWKQTEAKDRKSVWVGLIQISVALYHQRIGNTKGAIRILRKGLDILEEKRDAIKKLGLADEELLILLRKRFKELNSGVPYYSVNLPIQDEQLLETAMKRCLLLGYNWNEKSNISNLSLVKKHSLRDRQHVIQERAKQLELKKNKRPDS